MAYLARLGIGVLLMAATAVSPQSGEKGPVFRNDGSLVLPSGFRSWVFIGGPITPNGLNDGNAPFPEFHSVYIEGKNLRYYQKNGKFPEGTVLVKEKYAAVTGGEPELMTIMIKREKGFNPKGGDWEYAVADGKGTAIRERGKIAECQSCHASRKKQDFVFRTYRPGGPKNPWDEGPLLPLHGN